MDWFEGTAAADGIVSSLTEGCAVPKDWFGRAVWLSHAASALKKVLSEVEAEYRIAVEVILDDGIVDDTYELVQLTKEERMLDGAKLRVNNPALYSQCAFVDADKMVKAVGKPVLRQMLIEKLGADAVLPLESVTIQSVEEIVGRECAEEYITCVTVPNGYVVREKGAV
ncbi:MAG TPA: hypothetical protein O0X42_00620 [Methanocorpusculum sp.]|nr:hypothetical protein [Methanocorpusculum sp.]